jgi:hypothetical protein
MRVASCSPHAHAQVAALAHVLADHQHVWVDIFAVRQWPGNVADIDFAPVVREAKGFVLVARHLQEVEDMTIIDALARRVPEEAFRTCTFFRLWCVVELAAALKYHKPVVMLVARRQRRAAALVRTRGCSTTSLTFCRWSRAARR